MARKLLSTQQIVNLSSDPGSGTTGEVYYNTATNKLKYYNGSEWLEITNLSSIISSAAEDDVLRYDISSSAWKNTKENIITAKNTSGSTIAAFMPVYIYEEQTSSTDIGFKLANASSAVLTVPAHGITTSSVANSAYTKIVTSGIVRGITLSGYSDGDLLYVASGGGFTKTRPTGSDAIQPFGAVLSAFNGTIIVFGNTFVSWLNNFPDLANGKIWKGDSGGRPQEVTLDTNIVPENTNLYFTDERAQDASASMITGGSHTGISTSYNDGAGTLSITNTGVTSLSGTANEIGVSASTGSVQLSFPSTVNLPSDTSIGTVSSTEISYLDGVTSAIQTQINNKADTSHTQAASTITDFDEAAQDASASMITGATHVNISASYNDSSNLLTLTGASQYTDELAQDAVATAISAGTHSNISITYNDGAGSISFALTDDVTIADDLTVTGDLSVLGNLTYANDLIIDDPLIYIGEGNTGNTVDLGVVASFNDGTYQHTGIVRDATDGKWKFFSSVEDEPTTTVNFAQAVYDTLQIGKLENTGTTITLNSLESGVPSSNAVFEVERGSSSNVSIRWNESLDVWEFTNDGSTYTEIGSSSAGGSGSVQTDTVLSNSWWLGV